MERVHQSAEYRQQAAAWRRQDILFPHGAHFTSKTWGIINRRQILIWSITLGWFWRFIISNKSNRQTKANNTVSPLRSESLSLTLTGTKVKNMLTDIESSLRVTDRWRFYGENPVKLSSVQWRRQTWIQTMNCCTFTSKTLKFRWTGCVCLFPEIMTQ